MKNDYKAENVVKFMEDFVKGEEDFGRDFFERLSCMFTTVALMCDVCEGTYVCDTLIKALWDDIESNCDLHYTSEDYDEFYNLMVKWIV